MGALIVISPFSHSFGGLRMGHSSSFGAFAQSQLAGIESGLAIKHRYILAAGSGGLMRPAPKSG